MFNIELSSHVFT